MALPGGPISIQQGMKCGLSKTRSTPFGSFLQLRYVVTADTWMRRCHEGGVGTDFASTRPHDSQVFFRDIGD